MSIIQECEGQAQYLNEWIEARKRQSRLQVLPKTEITEQEETQALVECMDVWGWSIIWATIIGILVLALVNHYGLWIIPGLASVWGLKKVWGKLLA